MSDKALTYDSGKEPLAWLPWAAIDELSRVQQYGHAKYKDFNNYRKGMEISRNLSCALRHIRDYLEGHDVDHESGRNPLAHAMCRIGFVLQNLNDGTAIDDRFKTSKPAPELTARESMDREIADQRPDWVADEPRGLRAVAKLTQDEAARERFRSYDLVAEKLSG